MYPLLYWHKKNLARWLCESARICPLLKRLHLHFSFYSAVKNWSICHARSLEVQTEGAESMSIDERRFFCHMFENKCSSSFCRSPFPYDGETGRSDLFIRADAEKTSKDSFACKCPTSTLTKQKRQTNIVVYRKSIWEEEKKKNPYFRFEFRSCLSDRPVQLHSPYRVVHSSRFSNILEQKSDTSVRPKHLINQLPLGRKGIDPLFCANGEKNTS